MEAIRVPQVSLVDCSGKRIGIYSNDAGWWQQIQNGHEKNVILSASNTQLNGGKSSEPKNKIHSGKVSPMSEQTGSKTKLIQTDELDTLEHQKTSHDETEEKFDVLGETLLHIAIMYDDMKTIKFLIERKGYNVNQRCTGGKFSGGFNSKVASKLINKSKYESLAYYGEYPLALAACFSTKDIYDYLIDQGADPNLPDSNGNTVIHVLIINNLIEMFQYVINHPKKKGKLNIKNSQELTPINLAAMIGRKELFENMLELRKKEIWSWSTTQCSVYPIEGLDTIDTDGTILWNAALSFIVAGESQDHLDMLEIGVVKRLLDDKWTTYARKKFFQKLIYAVIHMLFLSIAVYTRPSDSPHFAKWPVESATTWVRYASELIVVIICLIVLFIQCLEIYSQGILFYFKNLVGEPANLLYQIFCILIVLAVPFRFVTFADSEKSGIYPYHVEDTLIIIAVPCGWYYMLFFASVFEITGPFVAMIYKMIAGDILTFASIFCMILFGFSLAFYYLYKNAGNNAYATYKDFGEALMITYQMALGAFVERKPEYNNMLYKDFTKIVFVVFMLFMNVLLLNLLIAMMGNTYIQVIKQSEKEFRKQWSSIVLLLERSFASKELRKFQDKYCVSLPNKNKNKDNIIALLMIREKDRTRAFIRAVAIRNWKRFYKSVFRLLKGNIKATQLLEKWSFDDIKLAKVKKEKKPFDWSQYDRKEPKEPEQLAITNKPLDKVKSQESFEIKSKSPKPPTPVKIISNGETKQMNTKNSIDFNKNKEEIKIEPEPKVEVIIKKEEPKPVKLPTPVPTPVPSPIPVIKLSHKPEPEPKPEPVKEPELEPKPELVKEHEPEPAKEPEPAHVKTPEPEPLKEPEPVVEINPEITRPMSAIRPTSRPSTSQKKTFFPNQTNRAYSPVSNSISSVHDDKNEVDLNLSGIKRPESSDQVKTDDSCIKTDLIPEIQAPKTEIDNDVENKKENLESESVSKESDSVSIKATLSPDSDVSNEKLGDL